MTDGLADSQWYHRRVEPEFYRLEREGQLTAPSERSKMLDSVKKIGTDPRARRGHSYAGIIVSGTAKVHNGDHIIYVSGDYYGRRTASKQTFGDLIGLSIDWVIDAASIVFTRLWQAIHLSDQSPRPSLGSYAIFRDFFFEEFRVDVGTIRDWRDFEVMFWQREQYKDPDTSRSEWMSFSPMVILYASLQKGLSNGYCLLTPVNKSQLLLNPTRDDWQLVVSAGRVYQLTLPPEDSADPLSSMLLPPGVDEDNVEFKHPRLATAAPTKKTATRSPALQAIKKYWTDLPTATVTADASGLGLVLEFPTKDAAPFPGASRVTSSSTNPPSNLGVSHDGSAAEEVSCEATPGEGSYGYSVDEDPWHGSLSEDFSTRPLKLSDCYKLLPEHDGGQNLTQNHISQGQGGPNASASMTDDSTIYQAAIEFLETKGLKGASEEQLFTALGLDHVSFAAEAIGSRVTQIALSRSTVRFLLSKDDNVIVEGSGFGQQHFMYRKLKTRGDEICQADKDLIATTERS